MQIRVGFEMTTQCEVPLSSTFGPNTLEGFKVWIEVVAGI